MQIPRVRFTFRRMMVAVAIAAILILIGLRSLEKKNRLRKLGQARYAAALQVYSNAEKSLLDGEINFHDFMGYAHMLLQAQRELGNSDAVQAHLSRMRKIEQGFASVTGQGYYDKRTMDELEYAIKEAEYWASTE